MLLGILLLTYVLSTKVVLGSLWISSMMPVYHLSIYLSYKLEGSL